MDMNIFFARHPVFRIEELDKFLSERIKTPHVTVTKAAGRQSLLSYHLSQEHIVRVRQGLYGVIPPGMDAATYPIDSYLIASRMTQDAVLAYHTALSYHGIAHSVRSEFTFLSEQKHTRKLKYRETTYRAASPPSTLSEKDRMVIGVEESERQGLTIRVTGWERTIADSLDRLSLVGGWPEAWRSLETIDVYLDLDFLIHYVMLLNDAALCAKVGYFLEEHRDRYLVKQRHIDKLKTRRPRQPEYVQRNKKTNLRHGMKRTFIPAWNLWIPIEASDQGDNYDRDAEV